MKVKTIQFLLVTLFSSLFIPPLHAQIGNIRGKVTDEQGNPIEDVLIRIEGMGVARKYQVKTDREGEFFHGGVSRQGTYRVIAEKEGFESSYVEGLQPGTGRRGDRGGVDFILRRGQAGRLAYELTDEQLEQLRKEGEEAQKRQAVSTEVRLHLDEGLELYNQGDYQTALGAFNSALELDDQQPALWANLGNTYSKLNQDEQALESYQKAIELAPEDPTLYQNLGGIYASMGETDKARELYEKAVDLSAYGDPKDAAINYYNMGVTFINSGKTDEAIDALKKAIEADPSYAEAHYQLGLCLLGLEPTESLDHLKKYMELAPNGPNADVAQQLVDSLGP